MQRYTLSRETGAAFADFGAHIIHGTANAVYLPKVIAFNEKNPDFNLFKERI